MRKSYVEAPGANRVYRPYIWDGCPGFGPANSFDRVACSNKRFRGGFLEANYNVGRRGLCVNRPAPPELKARCGVPASCYSVAVLSDVNKPYLISQFESHRVGGIGAAAVIGFAFMRGKKRQAKKKTAAQDLEMSGGNAV